MNVLLVSGSRADLGGLEAVHNALVLNGITSAIDTAQMVADVGVGAADLVVLLGDRFEILRTAVEVYLRKIPIAHLSGGDITEGSLDDSMRHAISKLSSLHFVTCQESAKRIIQMGEDPERVHVVGYPGADDMHPDPLPEWVPSEYILVVWHPNTLVDKKEAFREATVLVEALDKINENFIIIGSNADEGGNEINAYLEGWGSLELSALRQRDVIFKKNLPRNQYLGLLQNAKCLVGNSSSGFYEAPFLGTPVVNVGDRQKGRIQQWNMVDSAISVNEIVDRIEFVLDPGTRHRRDIPTNSPYRSRTGNAAEKIAEVISKIKDPKKLLHKKFHEIKY